MTQFDGIDDGGWSGAKVGRPPFFAGNRTNLPTIDEPSPKSIPRNASLEVIENEAQAEVEQVPSATVFRALTIMDVAGRPFKAMSCLRNQSGRQDTVRTFTRRRPFDVVC